MKARFPYALLTAFLVIGGSLAYLFLGETPRGQVVGQILLADANNKPLPDCDIYLSPMEEGAPENDAREHRYTVSDSAGRFTLRNVPAGVYSLSASARWHHAGDIKVLVEESRTTNRVLRLTRSEPAIAISDHQASFGTDEKPFLPVRGYMSAEKKPELHVRIWRTRLSSVLRRSESASALDELRYSYNGPHPTLPYALLNPPSPADRPVLVADAVSPIRNVDKEGFFVERTPIAAATGKPGLYLIQVSHDDKSSCSYLLVSDIALVVKEEPHRLYGYVVHIKKGTPIPGARLQYFSKSLLGEATTHSNGIASVDLPREAAGRKKAEDEENTGEAESDNQSTLVLASLGEDEAVVNRGRRYWGNANGDSEQYAVQIITDRTVYRPGDLVQYKGIVRRREGGPQGTRYRIPRNLPVTVEIRDVNGGLLAREIKTTSAYGTFSGKVETSVEGGTGTYTLLTQIGIEKHTADISVASYKKPEFSVTVTPGKPRYVRGEPVEMKINATYYFGTPVAGAKVHYYVYRDADWSAEFPAAPEDDDEDTSSDRSRFFGNYYGQSVADGSVTLDAGGQATVRVPTDTRRTVPRWRRHQKAKSEKHFSLFDLFAPPKTAEESSEDDAENADEPLPQVETYTLTAQVEDESKRSVEGEGETRVAAGDLTLNVTPEGYVASPAKPSTVFVTVRDATGKPVARKGVSLTVSLDEWDADKKISKRHTVGQPLTATTGEDGRAVLSVTPTKAGELRLEASAQDSAGRSVHAEGNLWAVSDRSDDLNTDYGDLSLLTDKTQYQAGETARILVNTARIGQTVLLSVEGERVYTTLSVPITRRSTVVRLPIREEWGPNVTLAACYVRDKKFASSETPLRVTLKAKMLAVTVEPVGGKKYQPGNTVTYAIETRDKDSGRPLSCDLSLSVVDESIYALREDDPKALKHTFYPARTNRVSTLYSFSVEYLGDVNKAEPKIQARTRFRDTAFWAPNLHTDEQGHTRVSVTLPDNLTTWRATINAVSDTTAVGYGISKVISSKPFFVRLETPRNLTGGDKSRLLALVHNETGQEQTVMVCLTTPALKMHGEETQRLQVAAGAVGKAEWEVSVPETIEKAPLRLTAWTPQEAGKTQYTDGIERTLPIRPYGKTLFATFAGMLENPGTAETHQADVSGLMPSSDQLKLSLEPGAIPSQTRLILRITPSVQSAVVGSLDYLIGFPYGCTEQTMSRFYPDLLVDRLNLLKDAEKKAQLPRMVRDGIARLTRFQHSESGGWGWWENDKDDAFMTAYVLHGLHTAKAQGYPVESSLLKKGWEAGAKLVDTCPMEERPFLLYALAETGYDDSKTNLLSAPFRYSTVRTGLEPKKLPTDALAYLVMLARKLGIQETRFFPELERREIVHGRMIHWEPTAKGKYYFRSSDRMATALALRVILARDPHDSRIPAILRWLMQSRTDNYFGNTRDTAWVMVALCDYVALHPEEATTPQGNLEVRLNDAVVQTVDMGAAGSEAEITLNLPATSLHGGLNTLQLVPENGLARTIFYSGLLRQTVAIPAGAQSPPDTMGGIIVKREVVRVLPQKVGEDVWRLATEPVPDGRFRRGDQLRIRLTLQVQRDASYVLIEDAFPAGAEVTERGTAEEEVDESQNRGSWFWYDHVDVLDDRIAFFARDLPEGTHVIEYNLRAQTPGVYHALPAEVHAMYDASVYGSSTITGLEVKP